MKCVTTVVFLLTIAIKGISQDDIKFEEPPDSDTLTVDYAVPVGGYKELLRVLQERVSNGDTLGKSMVFNFTTFGFGLTQMAILIQPISE